MAAPGVNHSERANLAPMDDEQLEGGITNVGAVARVGDHVVRPAWPHTAGVHEFLAALRRDGFSGAPAPVGVDENGRERLEFIAGDVPATPYPAWAQTDDALASVARLLKQFHDAARRLDLPHDGWNTTMADPHGGDIVGHNDVELSNIVFRNGVAVALIDFEFAAPGRPIYDLAQLARLCVPIDDELDQRRLGWSDADRPARLRVVADSYGLDHDGRYELLSALDDALDQIEHAARLNIADGGPAALAAIERTGGIEKYDRHRSWWTSHRNDFATALS
jgi:hypothetical protein